MKQLIYGVAFLVLTITITNMYGVKEGSIETEEALPFPDLPNELWLNIIELASYDSETCQSADENERSIAMLQTIRRVVPLTSVCRRFREIGSMAINEFLCQVKNGMEKFGGKDVVLGRAISNENEEVARLCLGLDSDIDAIQYTEDSVVAPSCVEKETLLTRAIKERAMNQIKLLLKLGADPMQPNAYGDIPIDLTHDILGRMCAGVLKDNGGDQENRYRYDCNSAKPRVSEYGREYGLKRLARQAETGGPAEVVVHEQDHKVICMSFLLKYVWRRQWAMFSVGVVAGSIGHWAYKKWKKCKKEREKQRQELWDKYYRNRIVY